MQYTVIKRNNEVVQIMAGSPTDQVEKWVEELNNNPLSNKGEWTIEDKYSDKRVWELNNFLFGNDY